MLTYHKLYLPKSKKEITICISSPQYKEGIMFDSLYLLDGQNAFKDSSAAFGRAIHASKYISIASKEMNKRIIGIAVYNAESEQGRIDEYSPFQIDYKTKFVNNTSICHNFCEDLIHTIIPYIEQKYPVKKDASSRTIYGSSLAATTAFYLAYKYNAFANIGAFSTALFLYEKDFYTFLNHHNETPKRIFLYVGKNEFSDDIFDKSLYLNSTKKLFNYFKAQNNNVSLLININGAHNEASWETAFLQFVSFIYNDHITYIE